MAAPTETPVITASAIDSQSELISTSTGLPGDATNARIYYRDLDSESSAYIEIAGITSLPYTLSGLTPNHGYQLHLVWANGSGESPRSNDQFFYTTVIQNINPSKYGMTINTSVSGLPAHVTSASVYYKKHTDVSWSGPLTATLFPFLVDSSAGLLPDTEYDFYFVINRQSYTFANSNTMSAESWDAPVAAFSFIITQNKVQFVDESTDATGWTWAFGDTATATVENPYHTYATAQAYSVQLTASNAFGTSTVTQTVTITTIPLTVCNDGTIIAPTTALDIIKRSLRLLTVFVSGETVEEPDAHDFLQQLNWQVQSFANEKLMSWQVVNEFFNLTPGKQTYSIGPDASQDFNTSLPIQIEGGFIRLTNGTSPIDWPLYIMNNEQFNQIRMKGISTTYPQMVRYTRSYPYGSIDFYPVPAQAIQVCFTQRKQFTQFVSLTDIVCLPPGYKDCLAYWLAIKMAPEYGRSIDQITMKLANDSKAQLKDTNSANSPVIMGMDSSVVSKRLFNFQSGWNAL